MNAFTLRGSWLFRAGARVASSVTIASLVLTLAAPAFFVAPATALAATSIFTESFGTGNTADDVSGWRESEQPNDNDDDAIARKGENSGSDMKSPNDGRFLRLKGDDEWACKQITTTGYQALVLKYHWRGDGEAESSDSGIVEVRPNGTSEASCNSNDNGGWTQIAAHPLDNSSNSNSTSQEDWALNTANLPSDEDGVFLLRFRNDSSSDSEYFRVDGITIEGDPIPGTLVVKKVLVQDNGGTADKDDFSFSVNNGDAVAFEADGQNDLSVAPGTYSVVETAVPGYTTTYDNCSNVQVASGQTVTCTITNNDKPAELTVTKVVVNTGGGTADAEDFAFSVNNTSPVQFESDGTNVVTLNAGTYSVSELSVPANYGATYEGCENIQLGIGGAATCTITNTYVPPPAPQCDVNAPYSVVSDTTTLNDGNATVALTFIHAAWTASIPGATWIWSEEPIVDAVGETNEVFTKTFTITTGVPTGTATLLIAADNSYEVDVNTNTNVCADTTEDNYSAAGQDTCTFPASYLNAGSNTLTFRVKNKALESGTPQSNPAGLLYKLSYNVNECEEALSCNPEVNLVKNPGFEAPIVTANSGTWELYANGTPLLEWMSSFLSGNESSVIEIQRGYSGWLAAEGSQFAELDSTEPTTIYQDIPTIPGKSYTFTYKFAARPDAAVLADNAMNVWWGGTSVATPSSDTVTAGPNTDWKSYSHTVLATTSLTRIAFQDAGTANSVGNFVDQVSVACQPKPPTSDVTICKYDTQENELSGWTLMLKGTHVEDVVVPTNTSAGVNTVASLIGGTSYIAVASGTWTNQSGANTVDAEYSTTDGWATQMDGYTGYQTDILELQINSAFDPAAWGPYNTTHEYAQSFVQGVTGSANFRIFDGSGTTQNEDWFGDNSGTLAVSVHEGFAGVTGENGCVTFTDVPYGTYTVGEIMKANWQNESGLASVVVDQATEVYEVVNKDLTPPPSATVIAKKVMCSAEQYLPNWGMGGADITATTAADWVAQSEGNCWLVEDWTFEWAPSVATNPGDNVLTGGSGWTSFTGSATVPSGSLLWLREQMPTGYVPFTGANAEQNVSAEFYCSTDVLNYDNYDWIDPVVGGQTYYCVGFNAPVETYEEEGGTLIIEKVTIGGDGEFTFGVEEVGSYEIQTEEGFGAVKIGDLDGTFDVVEFVPEGWDLTSVVCEYDGESEGEFIQNGKTIYIDEGDTVTCTFTNTKDDEEEDEEENDDDSPSTPSNPPTPPSGGGNPNFASFGGGFGGSVLGASTGQVLGASCGLYMDKFMRMGKKNDVEQVKKLQIFLNKELGLSIPVTGFFGQMTKDAVMQFQSKYAAEVLTPWGLTAPTGIVYQTTLRQINMLECPELALELPPLVAWVD